MGLTALGHQAVRNALYPNLHPYLALLQDQMQQSGNEMKQYEAYKCFGRCCMLLGLPSEIVLSKSPRVAPCAACESPFVSASQSETVSSKGLPLSPLVAPCASCSCSALHGLHSLTHVLWVDSQNSLAMVDSYSISTM